MRTWYKYNSILDAPENWQEYPEENAYGHRLTFFNKYYWGIKRHVYNRDFLHDTLIKTKEILSVASGRCAQELHFIEFDYDIVCSEKEEHPIYAKTKELFPFFRIEKLDVLKDKASKRHDIILALSLIFIFDDGDLNRFFKNMSESLKPGGFMIIDMCGSDNLWSRFIHWLIRKELQVILRLKKKDTTLIKKHHGYFRTPEEVIEVAQRHGFVLEEQRDYSTELIRVRTAYKLIRKFPRLDRVGSPYISMIKLRKNNDD